MMETVMTVMVNLERSDLCRRISQNVSPANHTKIIGDFVFSLNVEKCSFHLFSGSHV